MKQSKKQKKNSQNEKIEGNIQRKKKKKKIRPNINEKESNIETC